MPIGVCQTCRSTVRFEGVAGLCPKCGAVVKPSITPAARRSPSSAPPAVAPAKNKSGRSTLPDLDSLDAGEAEDFAPTTTDGPGQPMEPLIWRLSIGAGAVLLLFALYVVLSIFLSKPAGTASSGPPATPKFAPAPPPPPADDAPPPPPPAPVVVAPTTVPTSQPAWMSVTAIRPKLPVPPITDQSVDASLHSAVNYLKTQFDGDELVKPDKTDVYAGGDTLVVYSLLHAGEAIDDPDLGLSSPLIQKLLTRVKTYSMSDGQATYGRGLRASALAMFNRDVDASQLGKDLKYLLASQIGGAYGYQMPQKGATEVDWDNSNSQYGVLGIWAAVQAGIPAPDSYWTDVESHWLKSQQTDGGWGYKNSSSRLTMTSAGVTTLCVTAEQLDLIASKQKHDNHVELTRAINKGLDWMGNADALLNFDGSYPGYSLYGVERAALASGYRWFGNHDWYRDLGAREIKAQLPDGSWEASLGCIAPVETAFRVLFLSRGRQPIFMNKLKFDGDWNDRPRDAAKLAQFATIQLEKPFAWGVADLHRNWWDWMETPFLFISTDAAPNFSDEDCQKLRGYTDAGGLIFVHNEFSSPEVDDFVNNLVKRAYPEYRFTPLRVDDPIYSTVFPMKVKPVLKGVGNGTRTFLVYSPKDITQDWVRFRVKDSRDNPARQLGLNLFVAAAGKTDFRNRLDSPYEQVPDFDPSGTVPVFQVKYQGPWNPEAKAYERFPRWFQKQTSIKLDVQTRDVTDLSPNQGPVALMTGNTAVDFSRMDLHYLHDYVAQGGVLVIDSTGGNRAFAASVRELMLPVVFPDAVLGPIPKDHPILSGKLDCTDALPRPRLRNYASNILEGVAPQVQSAAIGKGMLIVSDLDLTTALLDSGTYGILGYTPAYSQSLMKNIILWSLSRYSGKPDAGSAPVR